MADESDKKYVVPRERRLEDINKEINTAKEASKQVAESLKNAQKIYERATEQKVLKPDDISDIAKNLKPVVDNLSQSQSSAKVLPKPSTADDNAEKK